MTTANKINLTKKITEQELHFSNAIDALKNITHSFFINSDLISDDKIKKTLSEMVTRLEELQSETSVNRLFNKIIET